MSKPWGSIGDWAADVEREEQEEAAAAEAAAASAGSQSFPSLKEAVTAKPKKKKMTLTEFYTSSSSVTGGISGGGGRYLESKGLTPDEMLRLPTGPKERSAEEMQYGRGFSNYGRTGPITSSGPGRMRDENDGGGWGGGGGGRRQYGGYDEERRGPPSGSRVSDYDNLQPSRADEVDNWASAKKVPVTRGTTPFDSSTNRQTQSRFGGLGSGGSGGVSRADEVDNWTRGKKPYITNVNTTSTSTSSNRSSSFGSGFRDGGGPDNDRWTRGGGGGGLPDNDRWTRGGGGGFHEPDRERERPRLTLDPPSGGVGGANEVLKTNRSNPFGEARPREEVLAEKGLDWKKLEMEIEAKKATSSHSSRPTSAHSSRPSSAHSVRSEGQGGLQQGFENLVVKPRPKVNPFGDAKPREVLLQERGQDWRKIDLELEHRRVDRTETEAEKLLKEEIELLKKEAQKEEALQGSGGNQFSLQHIISQKEKELEQIIHDFDDKIRFGQKAVERPGSGVGRPASFYDRPPSQSGSFDESRSMEYVDRPQSRGSQDAQTRPVDERKPFQGGRERGFLGSRDFDRSRSRERW